MVSFSAFCGISFTSTLGTQEHEIVGSDCVFVLLQYLVAFALLLLYRPLIEFLGSDMNETV
jgi:hypothetical protein